MITIRQTGLLTAVLAATSSLSAAQVETVATESFEYSYPGLLTNNSGGTGWVDSWDVQPNGNEIVVFENNGCLLYTSPSPRDGLLSRMPSSA